MNENAPLWVYPDTNALIQTQFIQKFTWELNAIFDIVDRLTNSNFKELNAIFDTVDVT